MYILIDDDLLIRKSWEYAAKKADVELRTFESVHQFLQSNQDIPKSSTIYIDQDLGNGEKGIVKAEELWKMGYERLILATGHDPSIFEKPSYLTEITGKKSPF